MSVLFIHGAFSRADHFQEWVRRFNDLDFACISPSLPGHDPADPNALARLSLRDYLTALENVRSQLPTPPVLIGHSMGGLLAQQLAATGPCEALVCLASAPPGILTAQAKALPYLAPLLPRILAGQPIHPPPATFRYLALHDLPVAEQEELIGSLGPESGRAYRAMILGKMRVDAAKVQCPVLCISGAQDRIISRRIAQAVASRYNADHKVLEDRGHWLIARQDAERLVRLVLNWLEEHVKLK